MRFCEQLSLVRVHAFVCVPEDYMHLLTEARAWRILSPEEDCCSSLIRKGAINV